MAVPQENVRELRIGEKSYELEASLGASITYRNEFFGRLDAPYKGILADDLLVAWRRAQAELDGEPNPEYAGIDVEAALRAAWAMAFAHGSTKKRYAKFADEVVHQPAGVFEEASLYEVVVLELGGGVIFRRPEGHGGAGEPDEAQG
jgi:hypothetical protein